MNQWIKGIYKYIFKKMIEISQYKNHPVSLTDSF